MSQTTPLVNVPGQPIRHRVIVYIDGFNLYFGLRDDAIRQVLAAEHEQLRPR